ncbi:MAG: hypothetical protein JSV62_15765 [Promethearchaeota archaeon]|nr:MAG: hypothetical protein JSV62_15765 [Candidatus Lokiarchaeota archaeon]
MSEESLREIVGLAKKSKWNQIKKLLKFILQKTLKKGAGYNLTARDVLINGKKQSNFNTIIRNKENLKDLNNIRDFGCLSLYQATQDSNNLIEISQNNGILIVLVKYLGPVLNDHKIFNFSVHLDALEEPFFTIGSGEKINGSEILEMINHRSKDKTKIEKEEIKKEPTVKKDNTIQDVEAYVFETLTKKNSIWNGTETKAFHDWKAKNKNKYQIETGKIAYYKQKPTKQFSLYLKNLINKKPIKKDSKSPKPVKKTAPKKEPEKEISEQSIFKTLTGKNAIWNGSETQNFKNWKQRVIKKYKRETGKNPYYNCKLTLNFKKCLDSLAKTKSN